MWTRWAHALGKPEHVYESLEAGVLILAALSHVKVRVLKT